MKHLICGVAVAGLMFTASTTATAKARKTAVSDQQLTQRIEQRITHSTALRDEHISVSVKDRVATLSGSVDERADKLRAERLARVKGVRRVEDDLSVSVRGTTGTLSERTGHAAHSVAAATKNGTKHVTGYTKEGTKKTSAGLSKTGEAFSDGWITTRVKTRFVGEDALKNSDINVDTSNHVVTLKGTVASEAGRERAMQIAKTTDGVHSVVDRLTIAPHK